jgi:hypothetical protein
MPDSHTLGRRWLLGLTWRAVGPVDLRWIFRMNWWGYDSGRLGISDLVSQEVNSWFARRWSV